MAAFLNVAAESLQRLVRRNCWTAAGKRNDGVVLR